jgi:hypothetical protein
MADPHTLGAEGFEVVVWAETANLAFFIPGTEADGAGERANQQRNVAAHTRRQYHGDTSRVNVGAHQRDVIVDPGARKRNIIPGKPFTVEQLNADGDVEGEVRQMSFTGTLTNLVAAFDGAVAVPCQLRSPAGVPYLIAAAANGG